MILSISEAKRVVLSMETSVKLPVMIKFDNVGAMFIEGNVTATCHTKQLDLRCKCVNEYVADAIAKNVFIKSAGNVCSFLILTLSGDLH